jgi:exodeoxyribonuclease VII small subunit
MVATSTKKGQSGKRANEPEPTFEATLARLDEIVALLEQGDLPLERSIELFEEGMGLTRAGMARLDDADRKIHLLLQANGQEREVPFDPDGGGES